MVLLLVLLGSADGGANDGIFLGIEPGILDNDSDGSVKLVHLMAIKVLQCLVSSLVQQVVVRMMLLCLAYSLV